MKDGAVACPFCGAAFVAASLSVLPPGVRSTAIATATALAIAAGACSSSPAPEPAYGPADFDATFDAYQGPETSVEDTGAAADVTQESAPPPDASADASGEGAVDGGTD